MKSDDSEGFVGIALHGSGLSFLARGGDKPTGGSSGLLSMKIHIEQ